MNKIFAIIAAAVISANLYANIPVLTHGALSVKGNKIVDQTGDTVSFAGYSLFWSNNGWGGENFYNASVVNGLYSNWNASIVRAAMGVEGSGGYLADPSNKQKVETVVDAAISEGLYVIIDWHSHHAENYESEAIQFFQEMATLYGNYDNVIYEIYNEPLQVSWNDVVKPYAESVIAAIRAIDSNNIIIVGTPNWSQDVDIASRNPITDYSNIVYALHFYAGTHGLPYRKRAMTALKKGLALMVTEWGTVDANGTGDVDSVSVNEWISFLCYNKISHCNWAVNDKNESASVFIPGSGSTGNWTINDLTPSGIAVKDIVYNWNDKNCRDLYPTSIICNNYFSEFQVYPNPCSDILNINFTSEQVQNIKIELINVLGEIIFSIDLNQYAGNFTKQINMGKFPKSLYFVILETGNERISKKVILK